MGELLQCSFCGNKLPEQYGVWRDHGNIFLCNNCRSVCKNSGESDDDISSPVHYRQGSIECIDAISSALTDEEFRGYIKGNLIKYVWREKFKGGDEDMKKIGKYIELYFERRKK